MLKEEIGGFLELEIQNYGSVYHDNAIAVNSGRNALEYILRGTEFSKVYIPYFTCNAVVEVIKKLRIGIEFYKIGADFKPIIPLNISQNEAIIYTNYFGLLDQYIDLLIESNQNLIVDCAQAFFYIPASQVFSFYSPRKFFGVPDGGFLYGKGLDKVELPKDISYTRTEHLLGRIEKNAEYFYQYYKRIEDSFNTNSLKEMSKLTEKIMKGIDYEFVSRKRKKNFLILQNAFQHRNLLIWNELHKEVPLCYPLLVENGLAIKKKLIEQKIYIPTYWPNVLSWVDSKSFEYNLSENLLCLPVDQRYGENEMVKMIKTVNKYL